MHYPPLGDNQKKKFHPDIAKPEVIGALLVA